MHPKRPFGIAVLTLSLLLGNAAPAAADPQPRALVVVFESSAASLPQDEIRSAIAKQLKRQVLAEPDPNLGELRILRNPNGDVVVRYHPPQAELERSLGVPGDKAKFLLLMAMVAQNLVSDESRELAAELKANSTAAASPHGTGVDARVSPPPAPAVSYVPVYVLGGLGAGGLIVSTYFLIDANSYKSQLDQECAPNCAAAAVERLHTKIIIADVSLGVGVLSLGVAAYLYFTTPAHPVSSVTLAGSPMSFDIRPVPGGDMAEVAVRF